MIGTLLGGLKAARAMSAYNASISSEMRQARRRRDRLLSEDPTQRADARTLLARLDERLQQHTRRSQAKSILTGAPADAVAVDKQAATGAMASATAAIAADGRSRADRADAEYERRMAELKAQRRRLMASQATDAVEAGAAFDNALLSILI